MFQLKTFYFHQADFYLGRILCINPASIYTAFFSLVQLLLNIDYFITPASIDTLFLSFIKLLFIQYFHHSSIYLYGNINPISVGANPYFLLSNFYLQKELVKSNAHQFNCAVIFVNPASIEAHELYFPFS